MQRVILHLGLAKTGTSWLQQELFPKLDVKFFHVGKYDVLNKNHPNMLLSFEGLSGTIQCNDRYINAYRLSKIFPSAKIILALREKESYIKSLYSQYIKGGGILSIDGFKCWVMAHPYFLDWDLYIKYLCRLFNDNIFVYNYEDFLLDKHGMVDHICDFISVDVPDDIDYSSVNPSLSIFQMWLWRKVNRFFRSKWNKSAPLPRLLNPCFVYNKVRMVNLF